MSDGDDRLPKDWIRKESKSKPGRFYYANKKTGTSVWARENVFEIEWRKLHEAREGDQKVSGTSKILSAIKQQSLMKKAESKKKHDEAKVETISQSTRRVNDCLSGEKLPKIKQMQASTVTAKDKTVSHKEHEKCNKQASPQDPRLVPRQLISEKTKDSKPIKKDYSSTASTIRTAQALLGKLYQSLNILSLSVIDFL